MRWTRIGLVVEIDGVGHRWGSAVTDDNLRQNWVTIDGETVLRYDLLALRLRVDEVMAQLRVAHEVLDRRSAA